MVALQFEFVIEVLVQKDQEIRRDFVTLAKFPYCPMITLSFLHPAEILDDLIIESAKVYNPQIPGLGNLPCPLLIDDARIQLEAIISENPEIVKLVEKELDRSKFAE